MTHRIAVVSTVPDARAHGLFHTLQGLFPKSGLEGVAIATTYTIDAPLSSAEVKRAADRLTNPLIESYTIKEVPAPASYRYAIEIGFLPGVTDNVGKTAQETIEDAIGKPFAAGEAVYSSLCMFLSGSVSEKEAQRMAQELYNPLIERASVYAAAHMQEGFPIVVPRVHLTASTQADEVDLEVDDVELERIGKSGIANPDGSRRGPLALSLEALKTIRTHFRKEGRKPTDVELESIAQAWSEHCKHTIFADPLDEVKEGIYRRYIKGATQKIRAKKGKKDFCVSVFKDNSGAIAFDDTYLVTHKVETHNSPSGLDPFGGSVTAIVGVNRDCLGFGLGAKPIANTFGFCVGDPHDQRELFRDPPPPKATDGQARKRQQLLPARRILEGVVRGINAGGNQSGIPTPLGFVAIDASFRGKPLVFGGTVGLIPRKHGKKKLYEKCARPGDYIVMVAGRVGLDGVHGATFSSESLSAGSPATAVQIGDPITQKKLSNAIIREARDRDLYTSITDNGAGGISGSIGEMAKESNGCIVDLNKVPLKYPGLSAWQIWISESQERMTLAVPKQKWAAFKKVCERHGVEATRVGTFTRSGKCVVTHHGKTVMDVGLAFLHDGRPITKQKTSKPAAVVSKKKFDTPDLEESVVQILARPSVGSIAFISRQYDHEVQGSSVTKPIEGKGAVNTDAAILKPLPHSERGIVLSHGYCPWYSAIDTYAMAAAAIDTAVANAVCAGASLDYLAILDNFCWSSSQKPERLYELKRAAKACHDVAVAYGTPFISGKDSMFNDFRGFLSDGEPIHIAALPTLLVSTLGVVPDVSKAMTIDFKREGDALYLIGETHDEIGASEYLALLGVEGYDVPLVDTKKNKRTYEALAKTIAQGLLASAISVGRGGLAVALGKAAVAGQLGAMVDLRKVPGKAKRADSLLFSESRGRVLVSVRPGKEKAFETVMKNVPHARLGNVADEKTLSVRLPKETVALPLTKLSHAYNSFFKHW